MVKFIISFFIFLFIASGFSAQTFVPSPLDTSNAALLLQLELHYQSELAKISNLQSAQKKIVVDAYEARKEFLKEMLVDGEFIFKGEIFEKVQSVFEKIKKENSQITDDVIVLLSRATQVNAFNTGDGFVVVNMGLLSRLQNEDQLAYVLCHELSHQIAQHGNKRINKHAEYASDKKAMAANQKEIKKILESEYKVKTQLDNLIMPGLMNKMRHSRLVEFEADSMGLQMFKASGYEGINALTMLAILDASDEDFYMQSAKLPELLNFNTYAFNAEWIAEEEASSLGAFEWKYEPLQDSLKTHPDCSARIAKLKYLETTLANTDSVGVGEPSASYMPIQKQASFELIESYIYMGNLGRAFYQCVHLLNLYPNDNYLNATMSRVLAQIAWLKKERKMGVHVSSTGNENTSSYNEVLRCLWNMSSKDCIALSEQFAASKCADRTCEPYLAAELVALYFAKDKLGYTNKFKVFKEKFPTSLDMSLMLTLQAKIKLME
jgi:predicted Zn-dependent protease